jgi:hypothetical protein
LRTGPQDVHPGNQLTHFRVQTRNTNIVTCLTDLRLIHMLLQTVVSLYIGSVIASCFSSLSLLYLGKQLTLSVSVQCTSFRDC